MAEEPGEEFRDFVCVCDDERRAAAAALRAEVHGRLAATYPDLGVGDANVTTVLLSSLRFDYGVDTVTIWTDQWYVVHTEVPGFRTYVQCDAVEDGLAVTWRVHAERAEGRIPAKMDR
ncbi:MAG TPA: hypothetical protein VF519_01605 [Mycobacteriales bacterium]